MTYADLAFVPWNDNIDKITLCPPEAKFEGFPNVKAWHKRMTSRPTWAKAMDIRARLMDEQGLLPNGMPKGVSNMAEYEAKMEADAEAAAAEK